MRPPVALPHRLLEDHQVDRRGVYARQRAKLTRTNSRSLDRVDLPPGDGRRARMPGPVADRPPREARQRHSYRYPLIPEEIPGDHTRVATPVPIPNTAVKHTGPMIVLTARK